MNDSQVILHFFKRLSNFPVVKITAGIFLWLLKACFGPVFRPAYGAVIILWLTDTATGFYYARANPEIKPESRRMYHGLVKLGIYLFLLLLGRQCSLAPLAAFVQTVIEGFIILTESYSVLENLQKIASLHGVELPLVKMGGGGMGCGRM